LNRITNTAIEPQSVVNVIRIQNIKTSEYQGFFERYPSEVLLRVRCLLRIQIEDLDLQLSEHQKNVEMEGETRSQRDWRYRASDVRKHKKLQSKAVSEILKAMDTQTESSRERKIKQLISFDHNFLEAARESLSVQEFENLVEKALIRMEKQSP